MTASVESNSSISRRFTKTIVTILAILMISSAMLVAIPYQVSAGDDDKWTSELYAWDPVQNAWVNGNLAGYHEGDLVGFKFMIRHDTGTATASPPIDSVYDHYNINKNAYGIDAEVLWAYNYAGWETQFPNTAGGDLNVTGNVMLVSPNINNDYYDTSGGVIMNYYEFAAGRFWIPAGESLYIYFQAHLAESAFYQNVEVDDPSTPEYDPIYSNGASYFPGASLQVALSLLYTGTSAQTQSIPVAKAAGSISGMKFNDANSNHAKESSEGGLSGWKIMLDGESFGGFPIHMEATTASDGSYSFSQVPWGTYTISEVQQPGWTQTYPTTVTYTVVVDGDHLSHPGLDFGNSMPGKIRAHKIIDSDGDMTTSTDRSPGVGWTFELLYQNGAWNSLGTKVTGSDGYTDFWENLMLGNYRMVEVSAPNSGYTSAEPKDISLTTADQEVAMTFYNYPLGNITVYKYDDLNGDGNWDGGEPALSGVTINLYEGTISEDEEPIDTGVTDANGKVSFEDLYLGSYTVEEIISEEWTSTNGATQSVVLDSPGEWVNVTFLNFENVDIKVTKLNTNEDPVENWNVSLWWKAGAEDAYELVSYEVTGADGSFTWTNLGPGYYKVMEDVPAGWTAIGPTYYETGLVTSGHATYEFTFVNFENVDIKVTKLNTNEDPVENWNVSLWWKAGAEDAYELVSYEVTGADGSFTWTNLGPGYYKVMEDVPAGWTAIGPTYYETGLVTSGHATYEFTFVNFENVDIKVTKLNTNEDPVENWNVSLWWKAGAEDAYELVSYEVTGADGSFTWTNLGPGYYKVMEDVPAGWTAIGPTYYETGLVTSGHATYEFTFVNFENVDIKVTKLNTNEDPVENWNVSLWWKAGAEDAYELVSYEVTGADGSFTWTNLGPGYYKVMEDVPAGWTAIGPTYYETGLVTSGHATYEFTFVNFENVDIKVTKLNTNEDPVENWNVSLWWKAGAEDAYELVSYEVTGADGSFTWTNLGPGYYKVMEDVPAGWTAIGPTYYETGLVTSGHATYEFTFVNFENVDIKVTKLNTNEDPVENWNVSLWWKAGAEDAYELVSYEVTGADGSFTWTNLGPGYYKVMEDVPAGWTAIGPTYYETGLVTSGHATYEFTFVNFENVDIKVTKLNTNEDPVENWNVSLWWKAGAEDAYELVSYEVTGADGSFTWTNLGPGYYKVMEDVPAGWTAIGPTYYETGLVTSGHATYEFTFVNFENVDIKVTKLNTNEDPVENWNVSLWWKAGAEDAYELVSYEVTGADGSFTWTNLGPGYYKVMEDVPAGWTAIGPTYYETGLVTSGHATYEFTFVNFENVDIKVTKLNTNEDPVENWNVSLWWKAGAEDAYELVSYEVTGADGSFTWTNLGPGYYKVMEDVPAGWTAIGPTYYETGLVTSGHATYEFTFVNFENVDIKVTKLNTNEDPVENWNVSLWWKAGAEDAYELVSYEVTGADGSFTWTNLGPGYYKVMEDVPAGWTAIGPTYYETGLVTSGHATYEFTFVNFENVDIKVTKLNTNEDPVENWNVSLWWKAGAEDAYELVSYEVTGADGSFTWTNLGPGYYKVMEDVPAGWTAIGPTYYETGLVTSGHATYEFTFVNFENVDIKVTKLNTNEDPVENWNVSLWWKAGAEDAYELVSYEVTGADGSFTWTNLGPGYYKVMEDVPAGWTAIGPTYYETGLVTSGHATYEFTFVNFENVDIKVTKLNTNEDPVENWNVSLWWKAGAEDAYELVSYEVTGADGSFTWTNLGPGYYKVMEDVPAGWTAIGPTYYETGLVTSGHATYEFTFVNFENVDIKVTKLNTNEDPVENWNVSLWWKAGAEDAYELVSYEVTGADGSFTWTNLGPGYYKVMEDVPAGWTAIGPTYYETGLVTSGHATYEFTFVNFENVDIKVTKLNTNEDPVENWNVSLWWKAGAEDAYELVSYEVTGADGSFTWTNLGPGYYKVMEDVPAGWTAIGPTYYETGLVTSGHATYEFTFVNFENVDIKVTKLNTNEDPVENWNVSLWWKAGAEDAYELVSYEVTGADGSFTWTNLGPGYYKVMEDVPAGWTAIGPTYYETGLVTSGHATYEFTFVNFENVDIKVYKLHDKTGDGLSDDDVPIEGWEVYLYKWNDGLEDWDLIDTKYTDENGCFVWTNLGPGIYKVGEEERIGWLPISSTEHEFGEVESGHDAYEFTFLNFEVLPCINVTKSVWWDIEEYQSHTQGYWKNHLLAWHEDIDPNALFRIDGTIAVDGVKFPGYLTYIEVFKTAPKGDASIILAHQYLAAKLNDLMWGAPDVYDGFIEDAEEFLLEHPVGSNPQGEDREYAIMLSEVLTDYNEGNHSGTVVPGGTLTYTVNVTNCGNVALYGVYVYDSLLDETFWLCDYEGFEDGILDVGEWWLFTYDYLIPEEQTGKICNIATAYGQAGPVDWNMWVDDSAKVCVDLWYYAATQGYWKNHEDAWSGISPDDEFFDSEMTWMEVFWTPPKGDLIIVLAHQYMASMLNDETWGVPAKYADVIEDATDFLEAHQIGDALTDEEKETAHDLAEMLAEYNEGGIHP
ncbi:MAG: collagen binding domain-containing protein [Methanomassiliicoccales archaeon]